MADLPPPVKPGDQLKAAWLNMLLAAVARTTRVIGGPGVIVKQTSNGITVSLANPPGSPEIFRARITARQLGTPPPAPAPAGTVIASTTLYTAEAKFFGFTLGPVVPTLGRPVRNDEFVIWPAAVGDECAIVRQTQPDGSVVAVLHVFTECIAGRHCSPPPPTP